MPGPADPEPAPPNPDPPRAAAAQPPWFAYVVQHHAGGAGGDHFDLLLDRGQTLWTWQLDGLPIAAGPRQPTPPPPRPARRIADHRRDYLNYEGPIRGGRGRCRIVDRGRYRVIESSPGTLRLELAGRHGAGVFALRLLDESQALWRLECQSLAAGRGPARPRRLKRFLFRWAVILTVLAAAYWAVLYLAQDAMLYPAATFDKHHAPQDSTVPGGEVLRIDIAPGGVVPAWFFPAPAAARRPRPAVMLFHGNGETLDTAWWDMADLYRRLGCSALMMEYRGYGSAAGKPSQLNIRADAVRFYDLLADRPEVDPLRIVFHGRSLGGAVAADLAGRRKPAALILQTTFSSVVDIAHDHFAPGFLVRNPYRTDRIVPTLALPVLIFHGRGDRIIPVAHARRLHRLIPDSRYVEFDCDHNDFPGSAANEAAFESAIRDFLAPLTKNGV